MEWYSTSETSRMSGDVVWWQAQDSIRFVDAKTPEDRLGFLHNISQWTDSMPIELVWFIGVRGVDDQDSRVRGTTCYALGRSRKPIFESLVRPLTSDTDHWVCGQGQEAMQSLASEPRVAEGSADSQGFSGTRQSAKLYCLERAAARMNEIPWPLFDALIRVALDDRDRSVRAQACGLVARWGAINRPGAVRLRELLHRISLHDLGSMVRKQAFATLEELETVEESSAELELRIAENTHQFPKTHLSAFQKRATIVELQLSRLERCIKDAQTSSEHLKFGEERTVKRGFLSKLTGVIQKLRE